MWVNTLIVIIILHSISVQGILRLVYRVTPDLAIQAGTLWNSTKVLVWNYVFHCTPALIRIRTTKCIESLLRLLVPHRVQCIPTGVKQLCFSPKYFVKDSQKKERILEDKYMKYIINNYPSVRESWKPIIVKLVDWLFVKYERLMKANHMFLCEVGGSSMLDEVQQYLGTSDMFMNFKQQWGGYSDKDLKLIIDYDAIFGCSPDLVQVRKFQDELCSYITRFLKRNRKQIAQAWPDYVEEYDIQKSSLMDFSVHHMNRSAFLYHRRKRTRSSFAQIYSIRDLNFESEDQLWDTNFNLIRVKGGYKDSSGNVYRLEVLDISMNKISDRHTLKVLDKLKKTKDKHFVELITEKYNHYFRYSIQGQIVDLKEMLKRGQGDSKFSKRRKRLELALSICERFEMV